MARLTPERLLDALHDNYLGDGDPDVKAVEVSNTGLYLRLNNDAVIKVTADWLSGRDYARFIDQHDQALVAEAEELRKALDGEYGDVVDDAGLCRRYGIKDRPNEGTSGSTN